LRVVVTGGSGFIGTQTVRRLVARGDEVVVADLEPSSERGIELVQCDLREPAAVAAALREGTDAVIHLAAMTSVLQSVNDPEGVFRTNVEMTHLLLERCRELGIPRFVFASTNAVVGDVGATRIHEQMVLHPLTPYGSTKAAGEMLMSAYSSVYGLITGILRFTNVYGQGMQAKDSVIARLMRAALTGGGIEIYGNGGQIRDYVYVTDAVAAIEVGLGLAESDTLTIGAGESVSMVQLHEIACEVTGKPIGKEHIEAKSGEMPAVIVDISYAATRGFVPVYDVRAGVKATWEDFLAHQS
jgi:UDP-glucose 4-epimerase